MPQHMCCGVTRASSGPPGARHLWTLTRSRFRDHSQVHSRRNEKENSAFSRRSDRRRCHKFPCVKQINEYLTQQSPYDIFRVGTLAGATCFGEVR
jgi:hypothetical protein